MIYRHGKKADEYGTPGSAGCDLRLDEDIILLPGESKIIDTGYTLDIPNNCFGNLTTRSSVSIKHGVILLPTNAIIDADFKDPIKLCLHNLGNETQVFNAEDRVAQIVIQEYIRDEDCTFLHQERSGGIGSTNAETD